MKGLSTGGSHIVSSRKQQSSDYPALKMAGIDNEEEQGFVSPLYSIFPKGYRTDIYIYNDIESPEHYTRLVDCIRNSAPHVTINIYLNTIGGSLSTTISIITAIAQSPSVCVGIIDRECASAGGMIFLACDGWSLSKYSTMMCHAYSGGSGGKRSDWIADSVFTQNNTDEVCRDIYAGFLSAKEIDSMLEGKDYYFSCEEISDRLEKLSKYREKVNKK